VTVEIHLRPEAEQDLMEAASWYEEQRHGLGYEFIDETLAMFSTLSESPLLYPDVHPWNKARHHAPFPVWCLLQSRKDEARCGGSYAWKPKSKTMENPFIKSETRA